MILFEKFVILAPTLKWFNRYLNTGILDYDFYHTANSSYSLAEEEETAENIPLTNFTSEKNVKYY